MRRDERKQHLGRAEPGAAALGVGWIDGGHGDLDAHLAWARFWHRTINDLQHLASRTPAIKNSGFHEWLL